MVWLWTFLAASVFAGPSAPLQEKVVHAFSARDGAPDCEEINTWAAQDTVQSTMRDIANTVSMPPWVPMKAARCVTIGAAKDPASWRLVESWMLDEDTTGFALVVTQQIESMTETRAVTLAELAVKRSAFDPRFGRMAAHHLSASPHTAVVELSGKLKTQ